MRYKILVVNYTIIYALRINSVIHSVKISSIIFINRIIGMEINILNKTVIFTTKQNKLSNCLLMLLIT